MGNPVEGVCGACRIAPSKHVCTLLTCLVTSYRAQAACHHPKPIQRCLIVRGPRRSSTEGFCGAGCLPPPSPFQRSVHTSGGFIGSSTEGL
eukprot:2041153-Pyramimonas_sp.AAC.1